MLHEFVTMHRDAIIGRARQKVLTRPLPLVSTVELESGVPFFLAQLSEALRVQATATPCVNEAIGDAAARHAEDLFALGLNVSQVIHDYSDICQAVTELAVEHKAPITVEEFSTLGLCLDSAIAEAVTEHARLAAQSVAEDARATQSGPTNELERLGQLTHEMCNLLNTAILAFHTLKRGSLGINGNTAAVLGRSLVGLHALVDSTLCNVRVGATQQRRRRLAVMSFLNDIAVVGSLDAEIRGQQFIVESTDPELVVEGDTQLLASAVMDLLTNAFKYTRASGRVVLRAHREDGRLLIEVEDECGGIPESKGDPFQALGDQRGYGRTNPDLRLGIAQKAVKALAGAIHLRNMPGKGCVFVIDVPLAAEEAPVPPALT